jgi:hypothetical protein
MLKKTLVACLLLITPLFSFQIDHSGIDNVVLNQPIILDVELLGAAIASIDSVEVFYKGDNDTSFSKSTMLYIPENRYQASLTPILNNATQFLYYFVVNLSDNTRKTLPMYQPDVTPFVVKLSKSTNEPSLLLINPEPNSKIKDGSPVVFIAYEDPTEILDVTTVKIKLDGRNVAKDAQIFSNFLTFVPSRVLKVGKHTIEFEVMDKNKKKYAINTGFTYEPKKPTLIDYKGKLTGYYETYSTDKSSSSNSKEPFKYYSRFNTTLKAGFLNAYISDYKTSEENPTSQPLNKTMIRLHDDFGLIKLSLHDSTPVLTPYTLNGINVNGTTLKTGIPGLLDVVYVNGQTMKNIEGDSTTWDSVASEDVTAVDGTYKQTVKAYQVGLKLFGLKSAFTAAYINDDLTTLLTSNVGATTPKENLLFSLYNQINFTSRMYVKSEVAASIYYADASQAIISTMSITSDATVTTIDIDEIMDGIPVLTTILSPLGITRIPIRQDILTGYGAAGNVEMGMPIIFNNIYLKAFGNISMPNFYSLGNTSVKVDDISWGTSLRMGFFKNMLSLSGGYKDSRDGFDDFVLSFTSENATVDESTSFTKEYRGMSNLNVLGLFNFGANYNLSRKNNGYAVTSDSLIQNETETFLYTITNLKVEYEKFKGQLNVNYNTIKYDDTVSTANNFDQNSIGLAIDTQLKPVKLKFNFSTSIKENKGVTPSNTLYNTYGARLDYEYIPKKVNAYASISLQNGLNNGDDEDSVIDDTKTTLLLGSVVSFPKKYFIFEGTKVFLNYTLTAANDNLDSTDKTKNYSEQLITFKVTTKF